MGIDPPGPIEGRAILAGPDVSHRVTDTEKHLESNFDLTLPGGKYNE